MKAMKRKGDLDPVVRYGDILASLRIQFWEYFSLPLLQVFADIAETGDLGEIAGFEGCGRTRDGKRYTFSWQKGAPLAVEEAEIKDIPGYMLLKGRLDFETICRLRNFQIFHLRQGKGYVG